MCRTEQPSSSLKTQNSTMAPNDNPNPLDTNNGYAFTANILLTITLLLLFLVILLISLHFYARWYLRRARRRRRRPYIVFHVDSFPSDSPPPTGLDPSVIHSLPLFVYSSQSNPITECAVCLSDFEENESGRVLPKCNHTFHVECIDMWFQSHSTCPLCRSLVEFQPSPESFDRSGPELVIDVCEPGSGEENRTGRAVCSSSSSVGSFGRDKEGSTSSFRSPVGRLLSFKRMLSRERKSSPSSPSSSGNCAVGCSSRNNEIETSQ